MPPFPECDVLCLLGAKKRQVEKALQWLQGKRRLYLVSCEETCAHSQVRLFQGETLLEQQMTANEIGWGAVFRSMEIVAEKGFEAMRERILESSQAAHLLLSETADWGVAAFSNARVNWEQNGPFVSLSSLKDSLKGVPAIVCGAGPSFEEAKPFLKELSSKALLIAAGTAASLFRKWGIEPHLVAALDKETPPKRLDSGGLLCMQSRLNPEAVAAFGGIKILAPESGPIPWESWWMGEREPMEFGWTVGNFATGIALYLGCDPIIWTGMDFCYRREMKYADGLEQDKTELVSAVNRKGGPVLTQRDWLAAANWHRQLASLHPERRWICTCREGLPLGEAVQSMEWKAIVESLSGKSPARLQDAVSAAPKAFFDPSRKILWEESVRRSLEACGRLEGEAIEEELVYRFYLAPLWRLWRPLFAREAKEEDLDGHRLLFFQDVLQKLFIQG